ncbi:MAG: hypothetical protein AB4038_22700 [Prochloraceae cyanobacterium]
MVEPRPPVSTVQFLDSYSELYQNLFPIDRAPRVTEAFQEQRSP